MQVLDDTLRASAERPEELDKGSIVIGVIKARGVVNAIRIARESFDNEERSPLSPDYLDRNVSLKVVKVIESYSEIVVNAIWHNEFRTDSRF